MEVPMHGRMMLRSFTTALYTIACGSGTGTGPDAPAGGGDGGGPVACVAGLTGIALDPADSLVLLDGAAPAPITFTAQGTFADGHTATIDPTRLAWSATRGDDTPPGEIDDGVLTPYALSGGVVTIGATDGCVEGFTTVTFLLDVVVGDPSGDWSGPVSTTGTVPVVVYPSDQTRFPRNIYRTLFQWRSEGYTQFRLTFEGPGATVTVFTDGVHALCGAEGCWEAGETAWAFIAGSNAGATATWTVDALDVSTSPPTVRRAAPITLGFSRRDVKGAVFYWSTTSAGIRRANVADEVPEDYLTGDPGTEFPDGDSVQCVACHVVSRDGQYMAAPVKADSGEGLWILEVTAAIPPPPLVKNVPETRGHGFATISPDNEHLVAAWGGQMWMLDRASGNYIADLPLGGLEGTHPDWSPDDTQLVFATGRGDGPGDASIAVIPYLGGSSWGEPAILVPAAGETNLFPMFSHDGEWIAYARGNGGHGDNAAQLHLVAAGGGAPLELIAANRVVSNQTTDGQHQNSQPTWAPRSDDELDWVAFNSKREYGVVLPGGTQQIWVAAIDRERAEAGEDPSYPAFRLQFQGLEENNHRAYWTLDVRDPDPDAPDAGPPADGGACIPAGAVCDPVTDTCCDTGYQCDTTDDGMTYTCVMAWIP